MWQKAINQIAGSFIVISLIILIGIAGGYEKDLIGFWEVIFFTFCDLILFSFGYICIRLNNIDDGDYR